MSGVSGVPGVGQCRVSERVGPVLTPLDTIDTVYTRAVSRWLDTGLTLMSECQVECRLTLVSECWGCRGGVGTSGVEVSRARAQPGSWESHGKRPYNMFIVRKE